MAERQQYVPGPAGGARIQKDGEKWTLVLVRELRHPREKVWKALTDPAHLREWAPFDAEGNLGMVGSRVKLTMVGAPVPAITETTVKRAEEPELLEYNWAGGDIRWELQPLGSGTRLTLWTNIGHRFIAMGAAGWHICFEVMDRLLDGAPVGRIAGREALLFNGWQQLYAEYSKLFGVEVIDWPPQPAKE